MDKKKPKNLKLKKGICLIAAGASLIGAAAVGSAKAASPASIDELMRRMTLKEKVCQMMVVYQYAQTDPKTGADLSATETGTPLKNFLNEWPVGGILYDAGSMKGKDQLKNLLTKAQSYSPKIPLLFSVDEEGGRVARIGKTLGYNDGAVLDAMQTYESGGTVTARANAKRLADNISYYGFNWDYAPVADVNSNPANPVIGTRAYSSDFDSAAELIPAAVAGFHDGNVACTLKHFPGHGDTATDTHTGAVFVHKSLKEIRENELKSFQAGIDAGADAVMIAHLTVDECGEPSIFSKELLTDILRNEMGFDGVIVTDGLGMKAVTDNYTWPEVGVKGVKAGIDVFLCPGNLEECVNAILDAVERGEISEQRIDDSVKRILTMKQNLGLI